MQNAQFAIQLRAESCLVVADGRHNAECGSDFDRRLCVQRRILWNIGNWGSQDRRGLMVFRFGDGRGRQEDFQ